LRSWDMAVHVTLDEDFQIAVPPEVREKLHLKEGDRLLVDVRDGVIVLVPEPSDFVRRLHGLHREVWEGIDAQEYVNCERDAWKG
jgi:AbrB family looped-hinge helix DNA binding protein